MHTVNLVLYARGATPASPRPLISVSDGDKNTAQKFAYAASQEYRKAEMSGTAFPELIAVREERDADESGRITATYTPLEITTGAPSGKPVSERDALFADKE